MTVGRRSVAMTGEIHRQLRNLLIREDGQEDLCLATYRPSTGATRTTALVRNVVLPRPGDREVHGNATVTGEYILRAAAEAHARGEGVVLCHSHPGARGWQGLSGADRDAESSFANLTREITGLPFVGMTLGGGDGKWAARHWDAGMGTDVSETQCENVRVVDDQYIVSWNDELVPRPRHQLTQRRSISCWGPTVQDDLARRSVLVIGMGSVGLDLAIRLAATGVSRVGIMDFDTVQLHNLDRLIGVTSVDAWLDRAKVTCARRMLLENATAQPFTLQVSESSVCEPDGLLSALDYDLVFCCVDRPWPRAVLNAMAYTDLVPVIDGGVAVDVFSDGTGMRGATWRSHVIRPGRPCLSCNRQLQPGEVQLDIDGSLEDREYIAGLENRTVQENGGQNVSLLAVGAVSSMLAQYVSFNVAPGGIGDPGPLQYLLTTNTLSRVEVASAVHCPYEAAESVGDVRLSLTGPHDAAAQRRSAREGKQLSFWVRTGRLVDDAVWWARSRLDSFARARQVA